ncbi:MAG: prephenate dehydrogenase [Alphaproteobacteria bacterium]|nr:prephenate dehydrogenase [Alphaproteobacteria bacterium]
MKRLGIIGLGAFGTFIGRHLAPHFDLVLHDACRAPGTPHPTLGTPMATLDEACAAEVVVICVPVQRIADVAAKIAPLLAPGTLVLDVASVKVKPVAALRAHLPEHVDIVGTHPLFGPQSAQGGLGGLKVSLCPVRGDRLPAVASFLTGLGLSVIETTPEAHDRQLAYVQGLTHLIGKIILDLKLEEIDQTTLSFDKLMEAVSYVRHDSDELFTAIEKENPYARDARQAFFDKAKTMADKLGL